MANEVMVPGLKKPVPRMSQEPRSGSGVTLRLLYCSSGGGSWRPITCACKLHLRAAH